MEKKKRKFKGRAKESQTKKCTKRHEEHQTARKSKFSQVKQMCQSGRPLALLVCFTYDIHSHPHSLIQGSSFFILVYDNSMVQQPQLQLRTLK